MIKSILRFLLHFFWLFGIKKNRIFFESYNGSQYSCSPRAIYERMLNNDNLECVWHLKDGIAINKSSKRLVKVKKKSFLYYYYLLTSRVLITNINFSSFIPFRKKQILINTWHGGGAYKYAIYQKTASEIEKSFSKFNYFLSSCQMFTDKVIKGTFGFKGIVLNCGLPRNDVLFENNVDVRAKTCESLRINKDALIVLYAPTYRDQGMSLEIEEIDFRCVKESFKEKFMKDIVVLCRAHHFTKKGFSGEKDVIDVSSYPNMQELLVSCDALITDYSSCMWDFSLTHKPCFLYAPDYYLYSEKRSFYTNIDEWGFPVAFSNEELVNNIKCFNNLTSQKRIEKMHKNFGNFETGNASEILFDLVTNILNERTKS